jgi:hypothetical protein
MRITSENLDITVRMNVEVDKEIRRHIDILEHHFKKVRILSPEKLAFHILKDHDLIQIPIPDENWGGAIKELPNGSRLPVINTAQPRLYQYFIAWHEVYHLTEKPNQKMTHDISTEFDMNERKADYFSSQMLLGPDVYDYFHELNEDRFVERTAYCMDTFKAPFKAILIQLYELSIKYRNLDLQAEIKNYFDIKLTAQQWEELFQKLSLDDSLVKPTYIIDLGPLKKKVHEKAERHTDVELYQRTKISSKRWRQSYLRLNSNMGNYEALAKFLVGKKDVRICILDNNNTQFCFQHERLKNGGSFKNDQRNNPTPRISGIGFRVS